MGIRILMTAIVAVSVVAVLTVAFVVQGFTMPIVGALGVVGALAVAEFWSERFPGDGL